MRPPCPDLATRPAPRPRSRSAVRRLRDDDDDESGDSGLGGHGLARGLHAGSARDPRAGQADGGHRQAGVPPYFVDDDPTNGKGFESAVAYAIADQLGFAEGDVNWVVEPFNSSYAPGPKDFDFDVNQISITPKRAEAVDFSAPYYVAEQAIVTLKDSDFANATSLADFADATIGVQIGTTSQEAVEASIAPSTSPKVFDTSNDVVTALKTSRSTRWWSTFRPPTS